MVMIIVNVVFFCYCKLIELRMLFVIVMRVGRIFDCRCGIRIWYFGLLNCVLYLISLGLLVVIISFV